jgi:16S rRNA (cytosine1402-N4)-methyltransferase
MPREVIDALEPTRGGLFVDATVGGGGHAALLLQEHPDTRVLGIDQDDDALAAAGQALAAFGPRSTLVHGNFGDIEALLAAHADEPVAGILIDLGVSSHQLDDAGRGFSFQADGPLDMRMDRRSGQTAADLVNTATAQELADILWTYGEERASRRIARAIVADRDAEPFTTTRQLADLVARVAGRPGRIHPATRTFQALRIAVNEELGVLERVLPAALEALAPGGRLAVITFHSLEDRIVKKFFREASSGCVCPPEFPICTCGRAPKASLITRKPIRASQSEEDANPRSRSAKLRAIQKLDRDRATPKETR